MTSRRMLIEDYELMMHARRAYIAWVEARNRDGEGVSAAERERRRVLAEDTRLDGALFMEWELNEEFDDAICEALAWCRERADEEIVSDDIPVSDRPLYAARRREAIERVIGRLREPA